MIKLKILRWEDDPGLSGWVASPPGVNICSHTYSYKREAKEYFIYAAGRLL